MSLISPKNFIAPLTNIWHLATIAVIALLFGVYRMAGGGINVENIKKPLNSQYIADRESQDTAPPEETLIKKQPKNTAPSNNSKTNYQLLDDLIAPDPTDQEEPEVKSKETSPLDDIAKQLGAD